MFRQQRSIRSFISEKTTCCIMLSETVQIRYQSSEAEYLLGCRPVSSLSMRVSVSCVVSFQNVSRSFESFADSFWRITRLVSSSTIPQFVLFRCKINYLVDTSVHEKYLGPGILLRNYFSPFSSCFSTNLLVWFKVSAV